MMKRDKRTIASYVFLAIAGIATIIVGSVEFDSSVPVPAVLAWDAFMAVLILGCIAIAFYMLDPHKFLSSTYSTLYAVRCYFFIKKTQPRLFRNLVTYRGKTGAFKYAYQEGQKAFEWRNLKY